MQMKISLPGVLDRASEHIKKARDWRVKSLSHDLQLLKTHINMVRQDRSLLDQFLSLWVDDDVEQLAPEQPSDKVEVKA